MSADAQEFAALATRWHLDTQVAIRGGHRDRRTHHGFADADRYIEVQILATSLKQWVRAHPHDDVEITGWAAAAAGRTFASDAHARTVVDSLGNMHGESFSMHR